MSATMTTNENGGRAEARTAVTLSARGSARSNVEPNNSDRYLVVEVAGDIGGSTARADDARWAASWVSYLASDERAALVPTRHVTRRCPECGCPDGGHTSPNCPGWRD